MPEFNRRYILLSVLVSIALIAAAFFALELGRSKAMTYVQDSQRSLERVQLVVEIQSLLARAESGQRDYIFIGDKSYLESYDHTKLGIADYLTKVRSVYGLPANAAIQPLATKLDELAATKLSELDATIALHHQDTQQAIALMRTHAAQRTMDLLQGVAAQMRSREEALLFATNDAWARANKVNRAISTAGVLLNICLILLAGYLVYRDMQRRTTLATDLEEQVKRQTRDLSALSTHLQRISETERSSLARELHDELGGLLVAIKMDLSQLRTKVDLQQPDIKKRWDHVQTLLSSGIDLKRRIIEQLHPSLLDNMGLTAALGWQASEIAAASGLKLTENYPVSEPEITGEAAIAIFRIAQEALDNIVKHARATAIKIHLTTDNGQLMLAIEDDGIGLPLERSAAFGKHGIAGMRHRLISLNGVFSIESIEPKGTRIRIKVPLSRISIQAEHAA